MREMDRDMPRRPRTLPYLRWWIGGLLFLSTVVNYVDRQTLSVLAPFLKRDYHWSNADFAWVVISFRAAYAIGQTLSGRLLDRVGTRKGLTITVIWYSIAALLTSLASGLRGFCLFRFLLGAGESANGPGATKAVAEWFPQARARMGRCPIRQRFLGRWRRRAVPGPLALPGLWRVETRLRLHRHPGFPLADRLASALPSSGEPSSYPRIRTADDPERQSGRGSIVLASPGGSLGTTAAPATDLGRYRRPVAYRSRLVLHRRLVRHLPGREGHPDRTGSSGLLDSLHRRRSGQFLRRRHLQLADPPRLARRQGPQDRRRLWRARHGPSGLHCLHVEPAGSGGPVRILYVCVCLVFHHGPGLPIGPVPQPIRGHGQRDGRDGRRSWNHCVNRSHRVCRRPLLLRAHSYRRQPHPPGRHGFGSRAGPQLKGL